MHYRSTQLNIPEDVSSVMPLLETQISNVVLLSPSDEHGGVTTQLLQLSSSTTSYTLLFGAASLKIRNPRIHRFIGPFVIGIREGIVTATCA
jgi:hypothetical protein